MQFIRQRTEKERGNLVQMVQTKTVKKLPKTSFKKKEVLAQLVTTLSPASKKYVFTKVQRKLDIITGGR